MKKIKYLFKRIKGMNFSNMFDTAKEVSKETGKNRFLVLFDIIYTISKSICVGKKEFLYNRHIPHENHAADCRGYCFCWRHSGFPENLPPQTGS